MDFTSFSVPVIFLHRFAVSLRQNEKKTACAASRTITGSDHDMPESPASLRHMKGFAYRCFLPDLAGFTSLHCARPDPRHIVVPPCKPPQRRLLFILPVHDSCVKVTAPGHLPKETTSTDKKQESSTTIHAGFFQNCSKPKQSKAITKSCGFFTAAVHTG